MLKIISVFKIQFIYHHQSTRCKHTETLQVKPFHSGIFSTHHCKPSRVMERLKHQRVCFVQFRTSNFVEMNKFQLNWMRLILQISTSCKLVSGSRTRLFDSPFCSTTASWDSSGQSGKRKRELCYYHEWSKNSVRWKTGVWTAAQVWSSYHYGQQLKPQERLRKKTHRG